jgi:diguanylate cyclase (GGDEF)-like protein
MAFGTSKLPSNSTRAKALAGVLEQTIHIQDVIGECVDELSLVNSDIRHEVRADDALPRVKNVLKRNNNIERKMHEVSAKLAIANRALTDQVRDRNLLDHQFAAAVEQEKVARHASLHDALTNLPNRALFDDRLDHGLAQARRHGWSMAVMFIDLDDFKKINDQFGHDVGDKVLRSVASRLTSNTRSDDTVSRYGGDEFLYLLTEIRDTAQVTLCARKLVRSIQQPCTVESHGVEISTHVTASIGIALFPANGDDAATLLTKADTAMYRAKQSKIGIALAE